MNRDSESNSSLLATKTPSEPGDDDTFAGDTPVSQKTTFNDNLNHTFSEAVLQMRPQEIS